MSFPSKASHLFPNAEWTGRSEIHVSIAKAETMPLGVDSARPLMAALQEAQVGYKIMSMLARRLPGMEWLMDAESLHSLLMVDCYRLLHGQGTSDTPKRLRNPRTGNRFHRIALMESESIVGGIRVWLTAGYGQVSFWFRFRIEQQENEATHERVKATALVESVQEEFNLITEYVKKEESAPLKVLESFV